MHPNEELFKNMLDLFANPLFRAGLAEFTLKAQQEGMEAAKKFWGLSDYGKAFPYSGDVCERMADWYKAMGFVTVAKYNELLEENQSLKAENQLLKTMIKEMQLNFFNQGGEQARQTWHELIDKQIKMNTDVANTFFEALRQFKAGG